MDKDYFYKLWVISLMAYVPIFQWMGEHMESGLYERLFRCYNFFNLALFLVAIGILCVKWKYMLNMHRFLSIVGMLVNAGLIAAIFSMWYMAWAEGGSIFHY